AISRYGIRKTEVKILDAVMRKKISKECGIAPTFAKDEVSFSEFTMILNLYRVWHRQRISNPLEIAAANSLPWNDNIFESPFCFSALSKQKSSSSFLTNGASASRNSLLWVVAINWHFFSEQSFINCSHIWVRSL